MDVRKTEIEGVLIVTPRRHADPRGFFSETYVRHRYHAAGVAVDFVQDNMSLSREPLTIRGLHFQRHPTAQAKLVQVIQGRILDIAVDIRAGSPTFGRHVAVELDSDSGRQLFIPVGFAHGFCTLAPDTLVSYKVSAPYSPVDDGGILWSDPALGIAWPAGARDGAVVSDKDARLPVLADIGPVFSFSGEA